MSTNHLRGAFLERYLADTLTKREEREIRAHIKAGVCEECEDGLDENLGDVESEALPEDPEIIQRGFEDVMRRMKKRRPSKARVKSLHGRINTPSEGIKR